MNKRKGAILSVLVLITLVGMVAMSHPWGISPSKGKDAVEYHGRACVTAIVSGQRVNLGCHDNTLTTAGQNYIKTALGTGTVTNVTVLALGNGTTPSASDTALPGLHTTGGLAQGNGDYTSNGDGNWTINKTWTATADNMICNVTGLYVQGGNLFAGTTFTSTTLQTNDQISVSYTVTVS